MSDEIRVRDRKTGNIRMVTRKAYMAMGPKVYEKLGPAEVTNQPQVRMTVSAPVIRPQIVQESEPEAETEVEAKPERKKPGRKPKSISSASDDAEK